MNLLNDQLKNDKEACLDIEKASSLGNPDAIKVLKNGGDFSWCRNI